MMRACNMFAYLNQLSPRRRPGSNFLAASRIRRKLGPGLRRGDNLQIGVFQFTNSITGAASRAQMAGKPHPRLRFCLLCSDKPA